MSEDRKTQADAPGGMDALFRRTLVDHQIEPSGSVWKGISRKLLLTELSHFNFTNLPKAVWIGAASAIVVGLVFFLTHLPVGKSIENGYSPVILHSNSQKALLEASSKTQKAATGKTSIGQAILTKQNSQTGSPVQQTQLTSGYLVLESNESVQNFISTKKNHSTTLSPGKVSLALSGSESQSGEGQLIVSRIRNMNIYELKNMPSLLTASLFPNTEEDTMLRIKNINGILNVPLNIKAGIQHFFSFDIGVAPELSVYRNNGQYSESNFWLNTGVTYHIGRFSIQTGLGLGYVFDQGDYRVDYKSKDSIGYFTSIVSFVITPGNKIVYTTKDIAVFDSIEHLADSRAISRYTYLQIPVLIGIELFESNRLSIGIKAGPSISFLVASKEAAPFIDYPHAQLIRVDNNFLMRVKMNWEVQAALDIEYRLTKKFSLYADPSYKHYFKPFETQESEYSTAKDPYSVGIEVGIRVNFGQKKKTK